MELPASEIEFWREFYDIYPFPVEREDERVAKVLDMLNVLAKHKYFPDIRTWRDCLPNYLNSTSAPKTEEQKLAEERAFVQMAVAAGFAKMENT